MQLYETISSRGGELLVCSAAEQGFKVLHPANCGELHSIHEDSPAMWLTIRTSTSDLV